MQRGRAGHDFEIGFNYKNVLSFHLKANVEVVALGVVSIGVLYGYPELESGVLAVLQKVFGDVQNVTSASLHFSLYCTDARFLEVLDDYESGKIKLRLEEEFLKVGIKTIELEVMIDNMKEVEERKAAIKER